MLETWLLLGQDKDVIHERAHMHTQKLQCENSKTHCTTQTHTQTHRDHGWDLSCPDLGSFILREYLGTSALRISLKIGSKILSILPSGAII